MYASGPRGPNTFGCYDKPGTIQAMYRDPRYVKFPEIILRRHKVIG